MRPILVYISESTFRVWGLLSSYSRFQQAYTGSFSKSACHRWNNSTCLNLHEAKRRWIDSRIPFKRLLRPINLSILPRDLSDTELKIMAFAWVYANYFNLISVIFTASPPYQNLCIIFLTFLWSFPKASYLARTEFMRWRCRCQRITCLLSSPHRPLALLSSDLGFKKLRRHPSEQYVGSSPFLLDHYARNMLS